MSEQATDAPLVVTFLFNDDIDGVQVYHGDDLAWQERSFDSLDQYMRFIAPKDTPVILRWSDDGPPMQNARSGNQYGNEDGPWATEEKDGAHDEGRAAGTAGRPEGDDRAEVVGSLGVHGDRPVDGGLRGAERVPRHREVAPDPSHSASPGGS